MQSLPSACCSFCPGLGRPRHVRRYCTSAKAAGILPNWFASRRRPRPLPNGHSFAPFFLRYGRHRTLGPARSPVFAGGIRRIWSACTTTLLPGAAISDQLEQIAAIYATRAEFLSELTLDLPEATGAEAIPPHLDEDSLVLSTIHSAKGQ